MAKNPSQKKFYNLHFNRYIAKSKTRSQVIKREIGIIYENNKIHFNNHSDDSIIFNFQQARKNGLCYSAWRDDGNVL